MSDGVDDEALIDDDLIDKGNEGQVAAFDDKDGDDFGFNKQCWFQGRQFCRTTKMCTTCFVPLCQGKSDCFLWWVNDNLPAIGNMEDTNKQKVEESNDSGREDKGGLDEGKVNNASDYKEADDGQEDSNHDDEDHKGSDDNDLDCKEADDEEEDSNHDVLWFFGLCESTVLNFPCCEVNISRNLDTGVVSQGYGRWVCLPKAKLRRQLCPKSGLLSTFNIIQNQSIDFLAALLLPWTCVLTLATPSIQN